MNDFLRSFRNFCFSFLNTEIRSISKRERDRIVNVILRIFRTVDHVKHERS